MKTVDLAKAFKKLLFKRKSIFVKKWYTTVGNVIMLCDDGFCKVHIWENEEYSRIKV